MTSDDSDEVESLTDGGEFGIPPGEEGRRLDQVLAGLLPGRSRAFIQKLFDQGLVEMAEGRTKPSRRVREGERVRVSIPDPVPLDLAPEAIPLDVLHEDADIIVINKRPGMVVHPSAGHRGGTLVNALLHHYGDGLSGIGGVLRPGIVHRLDRDTSGCLVAAKRDGAHHRLIEQFMSREVEKFYLAIVTGVPKPLAGTVEGNIGRHPRDRVRHAMLRSGGRSSLSHYRTLENYGALSLVECELKTGRTHQARVHLAHLGAPVLCDRDYGRGESGEFTERDLRLALDLYRYGQARGAGAGGPAGRVLLGRQALHAWRLAFRHPADGRRMAFEAPLPADMLAVLGPLREARAALDGK